MQAACAGGDDDAAASDKQTAAGDEAPADADDAAVGDAAANDAAAADRNPRPAALNAGIDPGWMVEGFQMALVARPAELWKEQLVTDTVATLPEAAVGDFTTGMQNALGQGPENLEQVLVLQGVPTETSFGPVFAARMVFSEPIDQEKLKAMNEGATEAEHGGHTYWRQESEFIPEVRAFYVSDDGKTLIMTTENLLKPMLDRAGAATALGKLAAEADFSSDVTLLVAAEQARPTVKAMTQQAGDQIPPPIKPLLALIDKLDTIELHLNLTRGDLLKGKLVGASEQSAQEAKSTLEAMLILGETFLAEGQRQVPAEAEEVLLPAIAMAEQMVKTAKFESDGKLVTFTLPRPEGFNEKLAELRDQAVETAKQAEERMRPLNSVRQVMMALHNHAAVLQQLPAQAVHSEDGEPLYSWRVAMLPFLEQANLSEEFNKEQKWDSDANKALSETSLAVFRTSDDVPPGMSNILAVVAEDSVIDASEKNTFAGIRDGMSNTIVLVEVDAEHAVPWAKPADWTPDPNHPTAGLKIHDDGMFVVGFADGSVRRLSKDIAPQTLLAMFTKGGGEVIAADDLDPDTSAGPGESDADDQFREATPRLDQDVARQEDDFEQRENAFERDEESELDPQDRLDENREATPVP
ncbi:MAG: DUF1559 domain-containing protein [Pirellulales bacterium]